VNVGAFAKLDDAQTAVAVGALKADIIAKMGNMNVFLEQGLQDGKTLVHFHFSLIDGDLDSLLVRNRVHDYSDCRFPDDILKPQYTIIET
jgi:hypothetical protein